MRTLLKIPEVAARLRISRSMVHLMIARGELPHVRIGRRAVRVPEDLLQAWLEARLRDVDGDQR